MRNDNKKSVTVGIFVLIGIIILVTGILTLGAQQKAFVKSIRVFAVFDDVGGLQTGNNVWFSGVKIGTVKKINFYGDSQVEIEMNIESAAKEYIKKNSKATISSDGLIGNKIIVIYGGAEEVPAVEDGDRLTAEMPLDTDKMMETLQENNNNLVSITEDLKVLTHKIANGEGIIGAVLTDSTLAQEFRQMMGNLQRTAINSSRMTSELADFSDKLNQKGGLMDDLINDTTVFASLRNTVSALEATGAKVDSAAANFNEASEGLTREDNTLGMLLNDEQFAEYLKSTMGNLDTGTVRMNETLEAMRYHWLFRGAFRKRDKANRE
ncbi:phospholipid/cholesterol/gamma-HCH transport system substrate-binding protein [Cyclobacterium lianum]|uniref:Phospholipid/cholesterol/gamma-HCH transport system substrate-binding protein n=1 Tax=Cyclobacterium lianum TaxID=388280 RepID=A0A1M7QSG3_9BACT|nr:MlaD family protein [Cyclobacterium lianum]SHN34449.1 phospholipid/cholesterol/gamma-HCH transport system substrate-binding protein [Cyclobacterium lianum]